MLQSMPVQSSPWQEWQAVCAMHIWQASALSIYGRLSALSIYGRLSALCIYGRLSALCMICCVLQLDICLRFIYLLA